MIRFRMAAMIAGLFLASAFSSPLWADAVLSISPLTSTVGAGGTATFDVNITGAVDLAAFQFDLFFDPTIVAAGSISEGNFLLNNIGPDSFTFFIPGSIDNVGGSIAATANTILGPGGATGDGTLAIFTLTGLAAGTSTISIDNIFLLDSTGATINNGPSVNGSVTVTSNATVPEPSTKLLLLAAAFSALTLLALKKRST